MVSLHKAYRPVQWYVLYIWDEIVGSFDYVWSTLDNRAMFDVVAKAYKLGYTDFSVGVSNDQPKDVIVLTVRNGDITVNWDIVRKLSKEEWNV